ncbi:DUF1345 domain-containing protein [Arthrobacter sp. 2RAF6]|uniref:DUF1345 domain-containing protein n=1 Tax=Arthrobacter sp. 2RAF6 TaxID=3233002 RepID=UPI003F919038
MGRLTHGESCLRFPRLPCKYAAGGHGRLECGGRACHRSSVYYEGVDGGIGFNQERPPCYVDFAYLAFTIGMTFQVSDTDLQTSHIRGIALRQSLLSYLFGVLVLATTINLVSGLIH